MIGRMQHYAPPIYLRNGHLQTVWPTLLRRVVHPPYRRERILTPDDDFLDLDWSTVGSPSLAILSHGLEGHSRRAYITGMVNALNWAGIDALAWNYRGCSGDINRQPILYHNGSTYDLDTVLRHATAKDHYRRLFLVGFSLGGNLSLLYAGEQGTQIHPRLKGVIGFSVPCELSHGSEAISRPACAIYLKRFLHHLHQKVKAKRAQYPELVDDRDYHQIRTFKQFDDRYTAPLHNFASAEDYWERCSCNRQLPNISIPALIVNALDDPILIGDCYPRDLVRGTPCVSLETPAHGGHVGFMLPGTTYWSELRTIRFILENGE